MGKYSIQYPIFEKEEIQKKDHGKSWNCGIMPLMILNGVQINKISRYLRMYV